MAIEVIGGTHLTCKRVVTGYYSLDRACTNDLKEIGVPIGHGYEIFGSTFIGKTTFSMALAGIIAKELEKNIVLADFELSDVRHITKILENVGFDGKLNIPTRDKKGNNLDDGEVLEEVITLLSNKDYGIAVLDSIAAISPIAEQESGIEDADMGRRAKLVAKFTRRTLPLFRNQENPKTVIAINHWYPKIGSRGYTAPGGEVKGFLGTVRILLKRKEEFPDESYVLEGEIKKNRWGYKGRKFYVVMLSESGLNKNLSTVYDAFIYKKAERSTVVKIGDTSYGRLKEIFTKARNGDDEFFKPFYDALNETDTNIEQSGDFDGIEPDDNEI